MNVNTSDWQLELRRLLETLEQESTNSLRKISRCFIALGDSFDENFRQYFLKKTTIRLDTSFDTVLFEVQNILKQCGENSTNGQATPNFNTSIYGNEVASNTNQSRIAVDNVGSLNTTRNGVLSELKIENNSDAPIEIVDSDNEDDGNKHGTKAYDDLNGNQMALNLLQESNNDNDDDGKPNDEQNDTNSNRDNEVNDVKCEPKMENEMEIGEMDLEFVAFDPNKENDGSTVVNEANESLIDRNQSSSSSSSSAQKQAERSDGKRYKCNDCAYTSQHKSHFQEHQLIHKDIKPFKCDCCDYAARQRSNLKTHQRTHDRQKAMGIVKDPIDGLFKCIYCDQQFIEWRYLTTHLTASHKNNQRSFNCERCMRQFTRKSEKDRHEVRCQRRLYECYLCRKYVAIQKEHMQKHMRTHTGARPFQCAICNKNFRQKCNLRYHLDSIHSRT